MKENTTFELPKASEKLSHKFILDSLKDRMKEEAPAEMKRETTAQMTIEEGAPVEACGTEILGSQDSDEIPLESLPIGELKLEPGKKYFRIGEVSDIIGVEPYVLRYWESEFSVIKPVKSGSGHRVYTRKDVEALHVIRHLLHEEKFSIKGAKKKLLERRKQVALAAPALAQDTTLLKGIAQDIKELIQLIRQTSGSI